MSKVGITIFNFKIYSRRKMRFNEKVIVIVRKCWFEFLTACYDLCFLLFSVSPCVSENVGLNLQRHATTCGFHFLFCF
jgi:hypothetical protein